MFSIFRKKSKPQLDLSWLGVDIHSHLLPGLDDGSKDLETSIYLMQELAALGLQKFICTPHIFQELYPNTSKTIVPALQLVKNELQRLALPIEVDAAAEYMIDGDFKLEHDLMCLPGNYLLIEMSYLSETPNIEQIVFDLQIKGYIVILAHPERYNFYHRDLARYQRFKDMGCLFQLNLLSVTGYYGKEVKKIADYILRQKFYDLAGTDLHHEKHLAALKRAAASGDLYQCIGDYPFKNQQLFR